MSTLYDLDQLEMNLPQMRESGIKVEISIDDAIKMVREISADEVDTARGQERFISSTAAKDIEDKHYKELKESECKYHRVTIQLDELKKSYVKACQEIEESKVALLAAAQREIEEAKKEDPYRKFFELIRHAIIVKGLTVEPIDFNDLLDESGIDNS